MKDVARMAGVSAMTVSRALRNPAQVASETRGRINAAIAELGYVPDLVAGSLSSRSGLAQIMGRPCPAAARRKSS